MEFSETYGKQITFIGATNFPGEIDEAITRRFAMRIYVPLPGPIERMNLFEKMMMKDGRSLKENLRTWDQQKRLKFMEKLMRRLLLR